MRSSRSQARCARSRWTGDGRPDLTENLTWNIFKQLWSGRGLLVLWISCRSVRLLPLQLNPCCYTFSSALFKSFAFLGHDVHTCSIAPPGVEAQPKRLSSCAVRSISPGGWGFTVLTLDTGSQLCVGDLSKSHRPTYQGIQPSTDHKKGCPDTSFVAPVFYLKCVQTSTMSLGFRRRRRLATARSSCGKWLGAYHRHIRRL